MALKNNWQAGDSYAATDQNDVASAVNDLQTTTELKANKGAPNGYAGLDSSGKVLGLANVDNTSDAAKNTATATLTGKTISGTNNTLSNISADSTVDGTTNKVFTATEKTKLAGIATAATANSADATLLSRANHTGTQTATTISDFSTAADARVTAGITGKQNTSEKGQANGYASLDSGGKVPVAQLPSSVMEYQGVWNASTNTSPTLANGTGSTGDVYRVSVAGTSLGLTFEVGDYIIYNGSVWEKSDTTDAVATVAGRTGNVTLTKTDVGLANVDNTTDAAKPVSTATQTALDAKQNTAAKGIANGYAALDGGGKVPVTQLPVNELQVPGAYSATIGNGTSTTFVVTHNLATIDVLVGIWEVATGKEVNCDKSRNTTNTVSLTFATAPATNSYRVVVLNGGVLPSTSSAPSPSWLITTVNSNALLAATPGFYYISLLAAGASPVLSTAVGNSSRYTLKNIHTGEITVGTTGSQTIEGESSLVLSAGQSVELVSDGSNWRII